MTNLPKPAESIPFATPLSFPKSPTLGAAVWLAVVGVALVFTTGCFMCGFLMVALNDGRERPITPGSAFFLITMYVMASACFGLALFVLWRGMRGLIALTRE